MEKEVEFRKVDVGPNNTHLKAFHAFIKGKLYIDNSEAEKLPDSFKVVFPVKED